MPTIGLYVSIFFLVIISFFLIDSFAKIDLLIFFDTFSILQFQENEAAKKALWKCIVIKDIIGDFIWYGLTLAFTVLVTYDSIIDIRCVNGKDFLTKKIQDQKNKAKETNPNIT